LCHDHLHILKDEAEMGNNSLFFEDVRYSIPKSAAVVHMNLMRSNPRFREAVQEQALLYSCKRYQQLFRRCLDNIIAQIRRILAPISNQAAVQQSLKCAIRGRKQLYRTAHCQHQFQQRNAPQEFELTTASTLLKPLLLQHSSLLG
jgi:hypothetical protein